MYSLHVMPPTGSAGSGPLSGLRAGISSDHRPALIAALLVPAAIWLFLRAANTAATHGFRPAANFLRGYAAASLVTRVTAVLLVLTGFIHLGLVPGHAGEAPALARLFAINGLLFLAAAISCFTVSRWRLPVAALLVLTVLAYINAIGKGQESPDQLGIVTKLIELAALGLVLLPARTPSHRHAVRRTLAAGTLVLATLFTGVGIWGVELKPNRAEAKAVVQDEQGAIDRKGAPDPTGMVMQAGPSRPPTASERAAADRLAAATKAGIARYEDVAVAIADGYRPTTPAGQPLVHYGNPKYMHDGRLLDPTRPEDLVYANTRNGIVLLGAMYMTEKLGQTGPEIAGPLVRWHTHAGICFGSGGGIAGIVSPFGTCPAGSINVLTPAMLHVWTVDGNPTGAYGELDPDFIARLTAR